MMHALYSLPNWLLGTLISGLSVVVTLAASGSSFFFIVAMDRPFAGKESVSAAPFQNALDNMSRWDTH